MCQLCHRQASLLSEPPSPFERADAIAPTPQRCYEDSANSTRGEPPRSDYLRGNFNHDQRLGRGSQQQPGVQMEGTCRSRLGHPRQGPWCSQRKESIVRARESLCKGPESKYCGFCWPHGFCLWSVKSSHKQCAHDGCACVHVKFISKADPALPAWVRVTVSEPG